MSCTPAIFEPLNLRTSSRFKCLTWHHFSPSEKQWICQTLSNPTSRGQQDRNVSKFCEKYNLNAVVINKWIDLYKGDLPFTAGLCVSIFSNCPVDSISMASIESYLNTNDLSQSTSNDQEWIGLLNEQFLNSSTRRANNKQIKMRAV